MPEILYTTGEDYNADNAQSVGNALSGGSTTVAAIVSSAPFPSLFTLADNGGVGPLFDTNGQLLDPTQNALYVDYSDNDGGLDATGGNYGDVLIGASSYTNTLNGGDGNDLLMGGGTDDVFDGGAGIDTISYANSGGGVLVDLGLTGVQDTHFGNDTLTNIENLTGSGGYDTLIGDDNDNILDGLDGDDSLYGNGGDDTLISTVTFHGNDYVDGGAGTDNAVINLFGNSNVGFALNQGNPGTAFLYESGVVIATVDNVETYTVNVDNGQQFFNGLSGGTVVVHGGAAGALLSSEGAGAGATTIFVDGAGNDLIRSGDGYDVLDYSAGGAAFEPLRGQARALDSNVFANLTADIQTGAFGETLGAFSVRGVFGDTDGLSNAASFEEIRTGAGNDVVYGNDSGMKIVTGAGDDFVVGGSGDDVIDGGTGSDTLDGGDGDDTLILHLSYNGSDVAYAGEGTDTAVIDLDGYGTNIDINKIGNRTAIAEVGNVAVDIYDVEIVNVTLEHEVNLVSYLVDGTLNVTMTGANSSIGTYFTGAGATTNIIDGNGHDQIISGLGYDNLIYSRGGGDIVANFSGLDVTVGDTLVAANSIVDGYGSVDTFQVNNGAIDAIVTGSGDDFVFSNDSGMKISTGNGDDIVFSGAGADRIYGGAGNDVYHVNSVGDFVYEKAGEGTDIVYASVNYNLAGQYIEALTLVDAALTGRGNSLDNDLTGNGAANALYGYAGNDHIDGGAGADKMYGGIGNDTYIVDNGSDRVYENSGEGNDTVLASVSYSIVGQYVETLTLTGDANLHGTGNSLDNVITGNDGANALRGMAGADILDGGAGPDKLYGGTGNDTYHVTGMEDSVFENNGEGYDTVISSGTFSIAGQYVEALTLVGNEAINGTGNSLDNVITGNDAANRLSGNAGNDDLHGGLGNDMLTGGAGADHFWFDTALGAANVDTITDFSVADDTIYLDGSIFSAIDANGDIGAAFHQGTEAANADDRIIYDKATGNIWYDADGTGSDDAILFAHVTAGTALTSADFFFAVT